MLAPRGLLHIALLACTKLAADTVVAGTFLRNQRTLFSRRQNPGGAT